MIENKGHVHHKLMMQYAQDAAETDKPWKLWQIYDEHDKVWRDFSNSDNPKQKAPDWLPTVQYRRKPITKKYILDLPEPMNEVPEYKSTYYLVTSYGACPHGWRGHDGELKALKAGICFNTEEDAQAFYDALKNRQPVTD